MSYAQDVLELAQRQAGERYVYGAEVDLGSADPPGPWDCSELVQWACARAGVQPAVPDGSAAQLAHCRQHGTLVAVPDALTIPGVLLFVQTSNAHHVAFGRGDGTTIEARGRAYGVNNFDARQRPWTHAARIPGVTYTAPPPAPAPPGTPPHRHATPTIRPGMTGPAVADVQRHLNTAGATDRYGRRLVVDGDYGAATHDAVGNLQAMRHIAVDHIVGPRTWAELHR